MRHLNSRHGCACHQFLSNSLSVYFGYSITGLVFLAFIHLTKEKCCKKALFVLTYKLASIIEASVAIIRIVVGLPVGFVSRHFSLVTIRSGMSFLSPILWSILPRENMSLALLQGEPLRTSVCYLQEYCLFLNHSVRNLWGACEIGPLLSHVI